MKWTYIVILSLLVSLLPALPYHEAEDHLRLISVDAPADMDNDGTPDEYDALVDGNAVILISVDSMEFNGTFDPNIGVALDFNRNDQLDRHEWKFVEYENISSLDGIGFGMDDLWLGFDINDNRTSILYGVGGSNGSGGEENFFDLSGKNGYRLLV